MFDPRWQVDSQYVDRRPSFRRLASQGWTDPFEMVVPTVGSRMVKPDDLLGVRINACQVRTFVHVAIETRPRQVIESRRAVMYLGDDMVDLKRQQVERLGNTTVFAAFRGPFAYLSAETLVHAISQFAAEDCWSETRALA